MSNNNGNKQRQYQSSNKAQERNNKSYTPSQGPSFGGSSSFLPRNNQTNQEPTSLLIIQNLANNFTEKNLRDELILNTYKENKSRLPIEITSVRMVQRNGRFTGVAFVGFKTIEQATTVLKYWNRAFLGKMRVTIQYAVVNKDAIQDQAPKAWSRHNEKSVLNKDKLKQLEQQSQRRQEVAAALLTGKKPPPPPTSTTSSTSTTTTAGGNYLFSGPNNDAKRKQKILQSLSMHPALYGLSDEERLKVINDERFHEYISGMLKKATNSGKLWDNDDTSGQTNILRALALAMGDNTTPTGNGDTTNTNNNDSNQSYEKVMKQVKQQKDSFVEKTAKGEIINQDDDDYFANPVFGASDDDDDDNNNDKQNDTSATDSDDDDSTNNNKKKKGMKGLVSNILDNNNTSKKDKKNKKEPKKPMTDDDFLRMAMGGFSDDEDDEDNNNNEDSSSSDNDDSDDDDDDDNNDKNNKKRQRSMNDDDDDNNSDDIEDEDLEDEDDIENEREIKKQKIDNDKNKKQVEDIDDNGGNEFVQLGTQDAHAIIRDSGYLFVRNLPYTTSEQDLIDTFGEYGEIQEVSLPLDSQGQTKGYARIFYLIPEEAVAAYDALSRTIFQGRILHILPGRSDMLSRNMNDLTTYGDDELAAMTHKRKKELMLKAKSSSNYNWNSLFISQDTIANAVASKFNMKKSDLLGGDVAGDNHSAAVRMAIAETHMIAETKAYLEEYGVNLEKFNSSPNSIQARTQKKSNRVILLKNIPFDTEEAELRKMFTRFGNLGRVILPPYKTLALIEYNNPMNAKSAYLQTSYKNFHNQPLYLEWAPDGCLADSATTGNKGGIVMINDDKKDELLKDTTSTKATKTDDPEGNNGDDEDDINSLQSRTLFVKNLNFDTKDDTLQQHFTMLLTEAYKDYIREQSTTRQTIQQEQWRVRTARIVKRTVTSNIGLDKNKQIGDVLSLGYGFIELSHSSAAIAITKYINKKQGTTLDNHLLSVRICQKSDQNQLSSTILITKEDLKKKTILRDKGILNEEKLQQQQKWSQNNNKIIVRNIPFEANVKEIRETFQSFGQVKRCTLPRKVGSTQTRGFAFVEFVTPIEAQKAVEALKHTHIFGRHLVLEWAKPDETIEELREKAGKK